MQFFKTLVSRLSRVLFFYYHGMKIYLTIHIIMPIFVIGKLNAIGIDVLQ